MGQGQVANSMYCLFLGILAPSRLGNPFVARAAAPQPNHTASPKDGINKKILFLI